jgi:23S rRNA C2498 (ribose-2'-O)-methylase RlmM
MDAIILYCERTGFELEIAAKLISGALKSKIKMEAEELNFLPKSNTAKLPL